MLRREIDISPDSPQSENERITSVQVSRIEVIKTACYGVLSLTFRKVAQGLGGKCEEIDSFLDTMNLLFVVDEFTKMKKLSR